MIKQCMSNGIRISFEDRGAGEPLVLLMGLGSSWQKWQPHMRVYEKHFRCIAIDNRGAGASDKPELESYSISDMAQDVISVLDSLGIASAHINGISMGGAIAQYLAIHYPERVKSVILTNTFSHVCDSFGSIIALLRDIIDEISSDEFARLAQWIIYSSRFQNSHREYLQAELKNGDSSEPMPAYAYKAQCNAILGFDVSSDLAEIKAPVLIAAGDMDLFVPTELTMEMFKAIPNAQLYMCKDGGHVQHWERLDAYNQVTLSFLLNQIK